MAVSKEDCNASIKRLTSKIENEKLDMKRNLTLYAKKENLKYSDRVIRNKKKKKPNTISSEATSEPWKKLEIPFLVNLVNLGKMWKSYF